jgi:hypothetical protein
VTAQSTTPTASSGQAAETKDQSVENRIYKRTSGQAKGGHDSLGTSIDYQKVMTEIVYINLPGPVEPTPGMSGGELLHGFLAELHESPNQAVRDYINQISGKWNVYFR